MTTTTPSAGTRSRGGAFPMLVGLTTLGILVQSLLASFFLQEDDRDPYSSWIDAHGVGADVTTLLGLATFIVAVRSLRGRRDLIVGSGALFVLLLVETGLGHLINGSIGSTEEPSATLVHIPLGMALMALAVFLSVRSAQLRRDSAVPAITA